MGIKDIKKMLDDHLQSEKQRKAKGLPNKYLTEAEAARKLEANTRAALELSKGSEAGREQHELSEVTRRIARLTPKEHLKGTGTESPVQEPLKRIPPPVAPKPKPIKPTHVALFDYVANPLDPNELSFKTGDTFNFVKEDDENEGWFIVTYSTENHTKERTIPGNYVEPINSGGSRSKSKKSKSKKNQSKKNNRNRKNKKTSKRK